MSTVRTQVTPSITRPGGSGGGGGGDTGDPSYCDLEWEINDSDNNDSSTYHIGTSYIARLHKGSDIGSVNVFNTFKSIFFKE